MSENPFHPPTDPPEKERAPPLAQSEANAAYTVVTDTVTGVNARWSDNRFQAISVAVSMVAMALLGAMLAAFHEPWQLPWYGGALIGSFLGMVFGIIGSGTFLMVYRALRHLQGKHD